MTSTALATVTRPPLTGAVGHFAMALDPAIIFQRAGMQPDPWQRDILFNEDDHYNFDQPKNNFSEALSRHAGWGYFDPAEGAGGTPFYGDYENGYQCPPVNWGINTPRKRAFFDFLKEVTGS